MSHDRFHNEIRRILDESDLTSEDISVRLGISKNATEQRLRRINQKLSIQIIDLIDLLDSFGYQIAVQRKRKR
jgi:predicted DNA-binding protein (UPF0251 family)